MRSFSMILALGLALTFAMPVAAADFGFSVRLGNDSGSVSLRSGKDFRDHRDRGFRDHRGRGRDVLRENRVNGGLIGVRRPERQERQDRRSRRFYPNYLPRYFRSYRDDEVERVPAPVVVAPPAPVVAPPVATPPPDPRGPLRLPARGATPVPPPFTVGQPLPSDLPHVTLDWQQYDLPEPPPGQLYARVGGNVLLISADDRIVESIVSPG
jgi:hypothetical protein